MGERNAVGNAGGAPAFEKTRSIPAAEEKGGDDQKHFVGQPLFQKRGVNIPSAFDEEGRKVPSGELAKHGLEIRAALRCGQDNDFGAPAPQEVRFAPGSALAGDDQNRSLGEGGKDAGGRRKPEL